MKVLLGVSGGVAAYKAAELVRELQKRGAEVQVVMTRAAMKFVGPLTFASLTGKKVLTSLWEQTESSSDPADGPIEHITTARWADVFVIAPATANVLAQLAHGMATDYLTTIALATKAALVLAPAMNTNMWEHPATQANLALLMQRGGIVVPPESGHLACGLEGGGRLASAESIVETVMRAKSPQQDLAGRTILVTAGGTREPIDPVRYLGNRSSGKMGHALAEVAASRGARVILVTASSLPAPAGVERIPVETARQMQHEILSRLQETDILIMAAAVADFRPKAVSSSKLRRMNGMTLEWEATDDIVAQAVRERSARTVIIAFAAETEELQINARLKLQRKGVDAIVANDVAKKGIGFDSDQNEGVLLTSSGAMIELPLQSKHAFAQSILDRAVQLFHARLKSEAYAETAT